MNADVLSPTPDPRRETLDYYYRIYQSLFLQPPRIYQDKLVDFEENVSNLFDSDPIIEHCFGQFKQKDFQLPESRRRIIILPQRQEPVPRDPTLPPTPPPPPVPSYKALENGDIQGQPEDSKTWLNRRLRLRKELESFGDVKRWLENKPSITPSEAKVLHVIHRELDAQRDLALRTFQATMVKPVQASPKSVPRLRLPKPPALSDMYSFLRSRKVKVLELFHKADRDCKQRISREEFIMTLKAAGVPLSGQEVEDIVVYLSSLGRHNSITMDNLANSYKQWSLSRQRSTLRTRREDVDKEKSCLRSSVRKQKDSTISKMDLLTVPEVDVETEARPMTLEEMEEVDRRYYEKQQQYKCCSLCESYGLPLTEDILMRALLYPGDKIIFHKGQVHPIRQPGGFYSDWKITPKMAPFKRFKKSGAERKMFKTKKMCFTDFEKFARRLKKKGPSGFPTTHPNSFWPGHLLDKLRLYLPTVAQESSLALFSHVRHKPQVYPAIHHPNPWWPLRDTSDMTRVHYDCTKMYFIS
ncbi:EF-hand calcium-binding domain-containing protein 12 isoform X2 [Marmota marmota marmota]|uniref:EF-hand calcium-binding domain-containing protein 12 isoform X2 n=1 Tax=Marmota marmota marmota TaxID=9994 RepID=UPI00209353D8|nr:EF-hand calcium-binding domain-containing protein 12 isoform X2 [Marmota marmota marmota]